MPLTNKYGLREPYFYVDFPPPTLKIDQVLLLRAVLSVRGPARACCPWRGLGRNPAWVLRACCGDLRALAVPGEGLGATHGLCNTYFPKARIAKAVLFRSFFLNFQG
ncbi:hypothetical protein QL285_024961 [Trifolium repens]|nr:hypothetical protein QL285_024961 [Trifolium repens]